MRRYRRFGICASAAVAGIALGCADQVDDTGTESGATVCTVVGTSTWWNQSIPEQTGRFHVDFTAIPSAGNIDAVIGLSAGAATTWASLAAIVRFNPSGTIDVRRGSEYRADVAYAYQPGVAYSIRLDVDVTSHTYSVRASTSPSNTGWTLIASEYPFRTEQSTAARLNNTASFVNPETGPGTLQLCGITVNAGSTTDDCLASDAGSGFASYAVAPGINTMIVDVSGRASIAAMDGVIGIAQGEVDAYNDLAASIRFWTNGYIEARDGDTYRADVALAYLPGVTYKFKFVVDLANKTYNVYVDDPAGDYDAVELGRNYKFRPQQATVTTLDHVATVVASTTGHIDACEPRNVAEPALQFAHEGWFWSAPTTNDGIILSTGNPPPWTTYRLDAQGKVVSSMPGGGQTATDTAGNIYVVSGSPDSYTVTSYTPAFATRWSRRIATNGYLNDIGVTASGAVIVQVGTGVHTIAADGSSESFVYGWAQYGSDFAAIGRAGFVHSQWTSDGVAIAAHRSDGTIIWSRYFPGNFEVHALAMGPDGSAVMAGAFFADVDFGDGVMHTATNENGARNAYVVSIDGGGNLRFSERLIAGDVHYVATNGTLIVTSNQNWGHSASLTMQVFDTAGNHVHDWVDEGFGFGVNGNTYKVSMTDSGRIYADIAATPWYPADGTGVFYTLALKP